jgi:intermediate peptidase
LIQLLYLLRTVAYHLSSDTVNLNISNFPKVRKQVYIVGNSEPRENIGVLNELIDARDDLAKVLLFLHILKFLAFIIPVSYYWLESATNTTALDNCIFSLFMTLQTMGCKSYADFAIRSNMAASADVVMSFLGDLSDIVRHKADEVRMYST